MDFSSQSEVVVGSTPDSKIAPIIVAGGVFIGRAVVGGLIGGATSWGVNPVLDNRFPSTNSK